MLSQKCLYSVQNVGLATSHRLILAPGAMTKLFLIVGVLD